MGRIEASDRNYELSSKKETLDVSKVSVIMPVGGLGTRARELTKDLIPKPLIELVGGVSILDVVCGSLKKRGFQRFILCVGVHGDQIIERFKPQNANSDNPTYLFSTEDKPLGGDGAIFQAIQVFEASNPTLTLPGDMFLPWDNLVKMLSFHLEQKADITLALTSTVTEWTTDVGRIWINKHTRRFERCFGRKEEVPLHPDYIAPLTSAGAFAVNPARYKEIYQHFLSLDLLPPGHKIDLRDNLLPWLSQQSEFAVCGYDLSGKILDLGTPERIMYARQNWQAYL